MAVPWVVFGYWLDVSTVTFQSDRSDTFVASESSARRARRFITSFHVDFPRFALKEVHLKPAKTSLPETSKDIQRLM